MGMIIRNNRNKNSKKQLISEINITPFVDVMLVLLVVFMVTAPMMISGINVNLPQANSSALQSKEEPLTITITAKHKVYIQDIEVNPRDIVSKLSAITKENKSSKIMVRGDKDTNYGSIIQIVGLINQAGYQHISLVTQLQEKK